MGHVTDHCPEIEYLAIMTMSMVLHLAGQCFFISARYPDVYDSPRFYLDEGLICTVSIQIQNMEPQNMYYHFGS